MAHGQDINDGDMNMINDGGPAFPVWELNGKDQPEMTGFGMTLRDWFAGLAMQGLLAAQIHGFTDRPANGPFASMSYEMADAMLKAREGEQ